jgi:hypothetical protein
VRKNIVVVLTMAVVMGAFSPFLLSPDQAHARSSSGCHEHGRKTPARSYDCCLVGHDVAVPQAFHFYRPAVKSIDFDFQVWSMAPCGGVALDTSKPLAPRPPGADSLRI